ncbi:MAG: extracellular solute-binding protein [Firmicutes bacterium]|nr:extracellular solute-binding protein [Bacillota bacterium]
MKRALLAGVAALLLLQAGPAKVGIGSAAQQGGGSLRWMVYNTRSVRVTYLAYLSEELPDLNIEYDYVPMDYFTGTLSAQLMSDKGPDLIEGGGETRLLASTHRLLDLTGQPFLSQYRQAGLSPFSVNGHVYAVPLQSWFEGIYYNKAIFAKHGLSPPATFDEWVALHKVLREAGIKPQTMGAQSWEPLMKQSIGVVNNEFYAHPENAGFDAAFDAGEAKLTEAWLPAVTLWSRMINEECLTPDMLSYSYDQALEEFATGGAAMWESGPWSLGQILKINPDIELGMFPFPGSEGGVGWLVGGPGSALAINADSPNKEAALRVLAATATRKAQQALIADSVGESYLEGMEAGFSPVYTDCADAFALEQVYAPWTAAWTFGNPIVETYGKVLQEVLAGTNTIHPLT